MIFLVGPHGAGKTETATILVRRRFMAIDLGPALRSIYARGARGVSFAEWLAKGEESAGPTFTDALLARELGHLRFLVESGKLYADIVVVGNRSRAGVEYLQAAVPRVNGHSNQVVFIDAPFVLLHSRYNSREKKQLTAKEFQVLLDHDVQLGIESLRAWASLTIWNDGTTSNLEQKLQEALHAFGY